MQRQNNKTQNKTRLYERDRKKLLWIVNGDRKIQQASQEQPIHTTERKPNRCDRDLGTKTMHAYSNEGKVR